MGNLTEARSIEGRIDSDERRLLAQRIAASPPFQKTARLRSLLFYLVEESIQGRASQLTEQRIGHFLLDRKSTRLNSSHLGISYAVFCLKKKKNTILHSKVAMYTNTDTSQFRHYQHG